MCKKKPKKFQAQIKNEEIELIGCCGAFFEKERKWEKYTEEYTPETTREEKTSTFTFISNSRLSAQEDRVARYWNQKSLRKHKDLNGTIVQSAARSITALLKGRFHGIDKPVSLKFILKSIDIFEAMANDPDVMPKTKYRKDALKKVSLDDFFDNRGDPMKSEFKKILDSGGFVPVKNKPYSPEALEKLAKKVETLSGKKITPSNLNRLIAFLNEVNKFHKTNKSKIQGSVLNIAFAIVRKISEGKQNFPFRMVDSDEMFENMIRSIAIEEGYLLAATRKKEEEVTYSNKRHKSGTTSEF